MLEFVIGQGNVGLVFWFGWIIVLFVDEEWIVNIVFGVYEVFFVLVLNLYFIVLYV